MGIIEDIKRMQAEGRQDQDITLALQTKGYTSQQIYDAIAQTRIKEAVVAGEDHSVSGESSTMPAPRTNMEPSLLNPPSNQAPAPEAVPQAENYEYPQAGGYTQVGPYAQDNYQQQYSQPGQYSEYYSAAPSSDTISEIAEQVVMEKMHGLKQDIQKIIDLKNTVDSKIDYLDERLKRIEKIIDRLQLSILQKVGDYITNVEDIKNELAETQKSFKALLPGNRGPQPPQRPQQQKSQDSNNLG